MPLDTVKAWAGQRSSRRQMFTRNPQDHRGWPSVPLVGLVEANTLRTLREMLAPSEVEAGALWIRQRFDAPFALANKRLVTDGAYAYIRENPSELYRVKTSQHAFVKVLEDHLKPLVFEDDDYPVAFEVRLPCRDRPAVQRRAHDPRQKPSPSVRGPRRPCRRRLHRRGHAAARAHPPGGGRSR